MMRLDKYLAQMGAGTRSEVKKQIRKGCITVNDEVVRSADHKVNEKEDRVCCNGQPVSYISMEYYMLHKPAGVVSATEDKREQTVLELITDKRRKDLFPAGRLDKDTEGLLLITNDGQLAHELLSPKKHVDKVYYAKILGRVTEEDVALFADGVNIGSDERNEWTLPAELEILKSGEESEVRLTIREGKFHQIKRMFQAVGKEVTYLKRESMGTLSLDETLKPGEYRPLTEEEIKGLKV